MEDFVFLGLNVFIIIRQLTTHYYYSHYSYFTLDTYSLSLTLSVKTTVLLTPWHLEVAA